MIDIKTTRKVPFMYNWNLICEFDVDFYDDTFYHELVFNEHNNVILRHTITQHARFIGKHSTKPNVYKLTSEKPFFEHFDMTDGIISINQLFDIVKHNESFYIFDCLTYTVNFIKKLDNLYYDVSCKTFKVDYNGYNSLSINNENTKEYHKFFNNEKDAQKYMILQKI